MIGENWYQCWSYLGFPKHTTYAFDKDQRLFQEYQIIIYKKKSHYKETGPNRPFFKRNILVFKTLDEILTDLKTIIGNLSEILTGFNALEFPLNFTTEFKMKKELNIKIIVFLTEFH